MASDLASGEPGDATKCLDRLFARDICEGSKLDCDQNLSRALGFAV